MGGEGLLGRRMHRLPIKSIYWSLLNSAELKRAKTGLSDNLSGGRYLSILSYNVELTVFCIMPLHPMRLQAQGLTQSAHIIPHTVVYEGLAQTP